MNDRYYETLQENKQYKKGNCSGLRITRETAPFPRRYFVKETSNKSNSCKMEFDLLKVIFNGEEFILNADEAQRWVEAAIYYKIGDEIEFSGEYNIYDGYKSPSTDKEVIFVDFKKSFYYEQEFTEFLFGNLCIKKHWLSCIDSSEWIVYTD